MANRPLTQAEKDRIAALAAASPTQMTGYSILGPEAVKIFNNAWVKAHPTSPGSPGGPDPRSVSPQDVNIPGLGDVSLLLDADQMAQLNDSIASLNNSLSDNDLALKQAHIQLNDIELPQIELRGKQATMSSREGAVARGVGASGLYDSALIDVERSRSLAETIARNNFNQVQMRYNDTIQRVNDAKTNLRNWVTQTSGENARQINAQLPDIPAKAPTYATPAAMPKFGAPPAPKPLQTNQVRVAAPGKSVILNQGQTAVTNGGRPIGMYKAAPKAFTISATPKGRTKITTRLPRIKGTTY